MKTILQLFLANFIIFSLSMCSKETSKDSDINKSPEYSSLEESKFYKEILLTNDTSGNSVLIKVSSESKADLDEFLSNNQLSLSSEIVDIQQLMNQSEVENKSN